MKAFALTIKRYWDGILNGFDSAPSNGRAEGINSLIQAAKVRAPDNGIVERFNGQIAEVIKVTFFNSSQEPCDTSLHYIKIYDQQIPRKALGHIASIQALKNGHRKCPDLFK